MTTAEVLAHIAPLPAPVRVTHYDALIHYHARDPRVPDAEIAEVKIARERALQEASRGR